MKLPIELILIILEQLTNQDLCSIRTVCKKWYILSNSVLNYRTLRLSGLKTRYKRILQQMREHSYICTLPCSIIPESCDRCGIADLNVLSTIILYTKIQMDYSYFTKLLTSL